jgi:flavin-dependent dehydrogenase
VIVGGSLAGMLAARVLSDYFDRVTLLERDRFPETPAGRKGLPQGRHAHGLLERGPAARGCRRAGTRTACWSAAAGPWSGSSRA